MWRWNIPILDDSVDYLRIIVFLRQSMTGAFNRTNRYTSMFISNYVLDSTQFNLPVLQQSISNYSLIFVIYVHWCAVAILTRYIYIYVYNHSYGPQSPTDRNENPMLVNIDNPNYTPKHFQLWVPGAWFFWLYLNVINLPVVNPVTKNLVAPQSHKKSPTLKFCVPHHCLIPG